VTEAHYVQQDQPDGVPPLELTGERTLPDVPEENYWYRRHLAVYEWIAERVAGQTVTDLACGEGYGAATLAKVAADVVGVDANPEAHAHAAARYVRPNLRFERDLVENVEGPRDAIVFLQTIEHIHEVDKLLDAIAVAAPTAYISTPNLLTLAPEGAEKSDNPWHLREYTAAEYRALLEPHFGSVEILGLFHTGKLRIHDWALKAGWDRVHKTLRLSSLFYDRFTPSIAASDFELRQGDLDSALDFLAICRR
jgi:SAM-dependent methyltransferase